MPTKSRAPVQDIMMDLTCMLQVMRHASAHMHTQCEGYIDFNKLIKLMTWPAAMRTSTGHLCVGETSRETGLLGLWSRTTVVLCSYPHRKVT